MNDTQSGWSVRRPRLSMASLPLHYGGVGPLVLTIDFLGILAIAALSGVFYHRTALGFTGDLESYLGVGAAAALLFVITQQARGLYQPDRVLGGNVAAAVVTWIAVFAVLVSLAFVLKISSHISRGFVLLFFSLGLSGIVAARSLLAHALGQALASGRLKGQRVALIGEPQEIGEPGLLKDLKRFNYRVQRAIPLPEHASPDEVDAAVADLIAFARDQEIDQVLIGASWSQLTQAEEIARRLYILPIPVRLVADLQIRRILHNSIEHIGPTWAVELQRAPLTLPERAVKRTFDLVLASLGLIVIIPLFVVVSMAIRLDSPGPIFFRQRRAGFKGRVFRIFKFRTMSVMEDGAVVRQATVNDARVNRVGRWLRRTSVDELPQLLNVIRGEMSLVGPRPHAMAHDTHYDQLVADYAVRHHVKPGITGWAQVNGFRGETASVELMRARVEHDLWYVNNWSVMLDIRTLALTVKQLLRSGGIY